MSGKTEGKNWGINGRVKEDDDYNISYSTRGVRVKVGTDLQLGIERSILFFYFKTVFSYNDF